MREGLYTNYEGHLLQVNTIRDNDEEVVVSYQNEEDALPGFISSRHEPGRYIKVVNLSSIENAFEACNFALYKGHEFSLFKTKDPSRYKIFTNDKTLQDELALIEVNKDWFGKDVNNIDLEKIWTKNLPALGLPMPSNVKAIEYIK